MVVRAEERGFHSQERAGKQREHTGVEPEARAGPKLQWRMRDNEKDIDKRAYVKKTKMSKCET